MLACADKMLKGWFRAFDASECHFRPLPELTHIGTRLAVERFILKRRTSFSPAMDFKKKLKVFYLKAVHVGFKKVWQERGSAVIHLSRQDTRLKKTPNYSCGVTRL